jgi:hypothetical protein
VYIEINTQIKYSLHVGNVRIPRIPSFYLNSSTLYLPTKFCLIPGNAYIVGRVLNPSNAYIRAMKGVVIEVQQSNGPCWLDPQEAEAWCLVGPD